MTTANHLNVLFKAGSLVGTIDFWQLLDGDKVGTPTSSKSSLFILPGKFLINLMEQVCFLFWAREDLVQLVVSQNSRLLCIILITLNKLTLEGEISIT
jgi:hypothetical protein